MLLVLTNSTDATADYLLERLTDGRIPFVRLDTDLLLEEITVSYELSKPTLRLGRRSYGPSAFSTVWYRRPERLLSRRLPDTPEGRCVLDEWTEALEGFLAHIPPQRWMNYPANNALASRKLEQLSVAQRLGLAVPDTVLTQDPDVLRRFFRKHEGKVIVKPLGRPYIDRPAGEYDSLIYTNRISERDLDDLADLAACPAYFQKAIGKHSDVRITVVDGSTHAIELIAKDQGQQRCDIRRNNMSDVTYRSITLPEEVSAPVQRLVSHYGLRFAAIDMALDTAGAWYFFEVNPNGQWAWLDLCGNARIYESFMASFVAAAQGLQDLP